MHRNKEPKDGRKDNDKRYKNMKGDTQKNRHKEDIVRDPESKEKNLTITDPTINTYHWKAFASVSSRLLKEEKKKSHK